MCIMETTTTEGQYDPLFKSKENAHKETKCHKCGNKAKLFCEFCSQAICIDHTQMLNEIMCCYPDCDADRIDWDLI